jgi:hypothetical protein
MGTKCKKTFAWVLVSFLSTATLSPAQEPVVNTGLARILESVEAGGPEQGFPRYGAVQTKPQETEKKSKAGRNEIIFGIIAAGAGLALMVNSVTIYSGARDDIEIAPRFWGGLACAGLGAYLIVHGARRDNAAIALPLAGSPNSRLEVSLGRGASVQYRRGW